MENKIFGTMWSIEVSYKGGRMNQLLNNFHFFEEKSIRVETWVNKFASSNQFEYLNNYDQTENSFNFDRQILKTLLNQIIQLIQKQSTD